MANKAPKALLLLGKKIQLACINNARVTTYIIQLSRGIHSFHALNFPTFRQMTGVFGFWGGCLSHKIDGCSQRSAVSGTQKKRAGWWWIQFDEYSSNGLKRQTGFLLWPNAVSLMTLDEISWKLRMFSWISTLLGIWGNRQLLPCFQACWHLRESN